MSQGKLTMDELRYQILIWIEWCDDRIDEAERLERIALDKEFRKIMRTLSLHDRAIVQMALDQRGYKARKETALGMKRSIVEFRGIFVDPPAPRQPPRPRLVVDNVSNTLRRCINTAGDTEAKAKHHEGEILT